MSHACEVGKKKFVQLSHSHDFFASLQQVRKICVNLLAAKSKSRYPLIIKFILILTTIFEKVKCIRKIEVIDCCDLEARKNRAIIMPSSRVTTNNTRQLYSTRLLCAFVNRRASSILRIRTRMCVLVRGLCRYGHFFNLNVLYVNCGEYLYTIVCVRTPTKVMRIAPKKSFLPDDVIFSQVLHWRRITQIILLWYLVAIFQVFQIRLINNC